MSLYYKFSFYLMSVSLLLYHCWLRDAFIKQDSHKHITEIHFKFSWLMENVVNCVNFPHHFFIFIHLCILWHVIFQCPPVKAECEASEPDSALWLALASGVKKEAWNRLCSWVIRKGQAWAGLQSQETDERNLAELPR